MDFSPDTINCISFCTGGGGLDLAVELAIPSARVVCMVEREAYACALLVEAQRQGLLAPAPVWTDARTFPGRRFRGCVDGAFGGIPCQPHSEAGRQLGEDDERELWSPFRRTIVQSGVWFVLVENVGGMLSTGGAERIHRDLRRLGFEVEAGLFTAEECCTEEDGSPSHERERLFILGVRGVDLVDTPGLGRGEGRPEHDLRERRNTPSDTGGPLADALGSERDGRPSESGRRSPGGTASGRSVPRRLFVPGPDEWGAWGQLLDQRPDLEPAIRRGSDGLANRVERLRVLGNGVVPVQGGYALRYLATSLALQGSRAAARLVRLVT